MGHPTSEPPRGSPWDDPLAEAPLAFVDLELTGLSVETDRVIEVCIERVRGGDVEARVATLVRPEPPILGNVDIHGIEAADLAMAPTYPEIAGRIGDVLRGAIVIAHAAWHDVEFLAAEHARAGIPFDEPHYIDTLSLSRRAFALKKHGLLALCETLGIPHPRPHRAEPDVAAMRAVFEKIVAVLRPATPRDLWHVRVGQKHARPEVLAQATRAVEDATDVIVRYRPAHRAPEDLVMRLTGVRADLDPPRVLGYLLASRSRRELRADRILAILPGPDAAPEA